MNDDIDTVLEDYLERAADGVPGSAPPLARVLEQGHRTVRRRRTAAIAAAAAGVAVIAGVGTALTVAGGHHSSGPVAVQPLPQAPDGTRWVGIGRTVFAVPDAATMQPGLYCPDVLGQDHVTIVGPHRVAACPMIRGTEPVGQLISLRDDGGTVTVAGAGADVVRSRTTLPRGWLAVPAAVPTDGGELTTDAEAQALTRAGFKVVRKAGPAGMTQPVTTEPGIGEPARVGSTVVVLEKPSAKATISGSLSWVGGPRSAEPTRHPGTIHLVGKDNGIDAQITTTPDGSWSYTGPSGLYEVTGRSPGFGGKNGSPDSCTAGHQVATGPDRISNVEVYCQRR